MIRSHVVRREGLPGRDNAVEATVIVGQSGTVRLEAEG